MTSPEIELMVDRLCAFWPQTNIARNTVKNGWTASMVLLGTNVDLRYPILERCKTMKQYPTLAQIEAIARELSGHGTEKAKCRTCSNNGWVYPKHVVDALDAGERNVAREVVPCPKCGGN